MNPYEKQLKKYKETQELFRKHEELDFYRIMWKGFFCVSAALNVAWWMVTVL